MRLGLTTPTREDFDRLDQPVRAVTRRLLADGETPVGVYRKLAGGRAGTFLLESAEQGKQWSRWSFVGVRSAGVLTEQDGKAVWVGEGLPTTSEDPLEAVREAVEFVTQSLSLVAPYLGEEMWETLGHAPSVARSTWADADPALLVQDSVTVIVQVAGKVRAKLELPATVSEADATAAAMRSSRQDHSLAVRTPQGTCQATGWWAGSASASKARNRSSAQCVMRSLRASCAAR